MYFYFKPLETYIALETCSQFEGLRVGFKFVAMRKRMKMNLSHPCWACKVIGMRHMQRN